MVLLIDSLREMTTCKYSEHNSGFSGDSARRFKISSEGSNGNSQNESPTKSGHRQDSAETSQNGNAAHATQIGGSNPMVNSVAVVTTGGISGPTTNSNIVMDYWGAGAFTVPAIHGQVLSQVPSAPVVGGIPAVRDGVQSQVWLQDERELKRQRRKISNRESANRSRLRKQAVCDELARRAAVLNSENSNLRAEVTRFRTEYDQLLAQNAALKERLAEATGQDDPRSGQNDHQIDMMVNKRSRN